MSGPTSPLQRWILESQQALLKRSRLIPAELALERGDGRSRTERLSSGE